ncbi:galactokinase [Granulicella tundricola]|uniref:Galactokinase n=1 Tax=Granulicella tundricola (strain ATCC BAA-1859 / DSM 23138 / MP5ACTX9) TaxID=1198114 RepID=E8X1J6_GRATM|nr:galactokinase [Granulicella tundricola]ADW70231.1 galactokinase [Granulicella tundricola MP5ACTX9]
MTDTARIAALRQAHPVARIFQAPGRVNLLGEHTDYSGGFCLPAALTFNTLIAATPRADSILTLHSLDFKTHAEFDLTALPPKGDGAWTAYPAGVAWVLQQQGIALTGADLTLSGNVPLGAGLSSSASVEVATATALLALASHTLLKPEVALLCQKAENQYVGANCGIMDQFISANGVAGNALALDTRDLTFELAPIPAHLTLVVANSMVSHSVAGGEYTTRRREVEEAAAAIGVPYLREATLADLENSRTKMSDEAFHRARHVITDSQRVLDGLAALRAGDTTRFGRLMTEAHVSYRDDFAASCAECDTLVDLALKLPGCLGSRLTGGGFGGCTVSLVEADQAETFAAALKSAYFEATKITADVFLCATADGAGEIV